MLFTQVPHALEEVAASGRMQAFLEIDRWNDYGYLTMFALTIVDGSGRQHPIGGVKFGRFDAPAGWVAHDELPTQFETLDDQYFSLGQGADYYANLAQLGHSIREAVLHSLRDMAYDPLLLQNAQNEPITRKSLLRGTDLVVVRDQLHRIAHGGARITPYEITYKPGTDTRPRASVWSRDLTFKVTPGRQPPTNIHVLIGRNGVGKTHLLRHLMRAVADRRSDMLRDGEVTVTEAEQSASFLGAVAVSFSAFDPPMDIPHPDQRVPYRHIGVYVSLGSRTARPRDRPQLAEEFAHSLDLVLSGDSADLWARTVAALRYSGSGFLEDDSWIGRFRMVPSEQRAVMARDLFGSLSSGHAIVLLMITSLVAHVQERTLLALDEPEVHLHPPLLAAFVRALSDLLLHRNGVAVVATHSPVVLQEVPAACVWTIRQSGTIITPERPMLETFGENVGTLTHEVFQLEVTDSGYHRLIRAAVNDGLTYQQVVDRFGGQLGAEARAIARTLIAIRDSSGAR